MDGVDHRDTYASRWLVKLQMCHHFYMYKSIFIVRGVWPRGASTPVTTPGAATADLSALTEQQGINRIGITKSIIRDWRVVVTTTELIFLILYIFNQGNTVICYKQLFFQQGPG